MPRISQPWLRCIFRKPKNAASLTHVMLGYDWNADGFRSNGRPSFFSQSGWEKKQCEQSRAQFQLLLPQLTNVETKTGSFCFQWTFDQTWLGKSGRQRTVLWNSALDQQPICFDLWLFSNFTKLMMGLFKVMFELSTSMMFPDMTWTRTWLCSGEIYCRGQSGLHCRAYNCSNALCYKRRWQYGCMHGYDPLTVGVDKSGTYPIPPHRCTHTNPTSADQGKPDPGGNQANARQGKSSEEKTALLSLYLVILCLYQTKQRPFGSDMVYWTVDFQRTCLGLNWVAKML